MTPGRLNNTWLMHHVCQKPCHVQVRVPLHKQTALVPAVQDDVSVMLSSQQACQSTLLRFVVVTAHHSNPPGVVRPMPGVSTTIAFTRSIARLHVHWSIAGPVGNTQAMPAGCMTCMPTHHDVHQRTTVLGVVLQCC
jgi:hypothetical protein